MNTVYFNANASDDLRRRRLYNGQLFVYSARESVAALRRFACELAEEAFAPYDPRDAQHHLPVDQYVAILAELKPKIIHHPRAKQLVQTWAAIRRRRTSTSRGCAPPPAGTI
jgi:hypothetical protein